MKPLESSITSLTLPARVTLLLNSEGIITMQDLLDTPLKEINALRGIGVTSQYQIKTAVMTWLAFEDRAYQAKHTEGTIQTPEWISTYYDKFEKW